jgi:hypothetical protein
VNKLFLYYTYFKILDITSKYGIMKITFLIQINRQVLIEQVNNEIFHAHKKCKIPAMSALHKLNLILLAISVFK